MMMMSKGTINYCDGDYDYVCFFFINFVNSKCVIGIFYISSLDMARTKAKFEVFLILVILVIRVIMVIMVIFNFR